MKKTQIATTVFAALCGLSAWAQTNNISSVGITTGVVTVTARIGPNSIPVGPPNNSGLAVGNNLAGLAYAAGNIPGAADTSISFFTLTAATLPGGAGNPLDAFASYGTIIGPPAAFGTYPDVAPLLTANSYNALTFVAPDLYPGGPAPLTSNGFYMIHRNLTNGTDYLAGIVPATGGGSAVLDIKPMAWTGGVAATGASVVAGTNTYFALTFAGPAPAGTYNANNFYYLRTDTSSNVQFGYMIPALTSGFLDTLNLNTATGGFGATGYTTLAFSATAFGGYAVNQFYYLRLDTVTGNTILGRLDTNPVNRTLSDIANLGGVYKGLAFAAEATGTGAGWGSNQLYVTGTRGASAQSVSFAAIDDKTVSGGAFTVTPSASSGLGLTLTVVSGSTGTVSITGPAAGVFTVTPLTSGVVTLQARQAGPGFDTNFLNQSFNIVGVPVINSAATASGTVGVALTTYNTTALGTPILSYAATSPLPAGLALNTTTGAITGTPTAAAVTAVTLTATNAIGTSNPFTLTITVAAAGVTPVINSSLTASGSVGAAFTYTITAANSPTSFTAPSLPAGLTLTGAVISGTPTTAGVTSVTLGATNATGTGNATLVITVAAAGVAPVINSSLILTTTVGTAFSYTITATNSPTSFSAAPLPGGVTRSGAIISGIPTDVGVASVTLGATNAIGTGNSILTLTMLAAGTSPPVPTPVPTTVPPAILAVLPLATVPAITNWPSYQPAQIRVQPVPGLNVTFNMTYRTDGVYTVGVGRSVIPGESLVTVASAAGMDLITTVMNNGLVEYNNRIRGSVVTSTKKAPIGLCATEEYLLLALTGTPSAAAAGTVVTVAFFYDESTAAAADQTSIEAYCIAVLENSNLVLQNSGITNFIWRFASATKVTGYTSNGNTGTDMTAMATPTSVLGSLVLLKSNEVGADQSMFIFNVFQSQGFSGRAERPGHNSVIYWQTPWFYYTHQLAHNFGVHHDRAFDAVVPDSNGQFSYGFSWTKPFNTGGTTVIQVGYGTILSSGSINFIQPYFSNPAVSITYVGNLGTTQEFIETRSIGVAEDQPKAANNARFLRESGTGMAGYRTAVGSAPTTTTPVFTITPVVAPVATPVTPAAPRSNGGGAPSLWFLLALSGLAFLRRKFARQ